MSIKFCMSTFEMMLSVGVSCEIYGYIKRLVVVLNFLIVLYKLDENT